MSQVDRTRWARVARGRVVLACALAAAALATAAAVPARAGTAAESRLSSLQPTAAAEPARNLLRARPGPASASPEGETVPGSTNAPNAVVSGPYPGFDGLAAADAGAVLPPDTTGDIGPNHYVQAVNATPGGSRYAIYTRAGGLLVSASVASLFASPIVIDALPLRCQTDAHGDPIVLYDEAADRWLLTQFAFRTTAGIANPPFKQCIAVSQTPDPTGLWHTYEFTITDGVVGHENYLPDYPKLGVWSDAYTYTANTFDVNQTTGATAAVGAFIGAFNRADLLAGSLTPRVVVRFLGTQNPLDPDDIPYGILPADIDGGFGGAAGELPGAGTGGLFAYMTDTNFFQSADALYVLELDVSWTPTVTSTLVSSGPLPVSAFSSALCNLSRNCLPQPGGAPGLDPIAGQLMQRAGYRNRGGVESIVVNHVLDASGGLGQNHAGVRWYELRRQGGAWQVAQEGTLAPDTDHRFMASAAMDRGGNIALGYSVTGPATNPGLRFSGRYASLAPGTLLVGEGTLVAGGGAQTSATSRFGDYSSLNVDPTDGCTFWFTGEYYAATSSAGWRTRIGTFALVDDPQLTSPTHTIGQWSNQPAATVLFSGANANCGLDGYSYAWDANAGSPADASKDIEETSGGLTGLAIPEGVQTFLRVRAVDSRGNLGPGTTIGPFQFDGTAPSGVALAGKGVERRFRTSLRIPLAWSATDAAATGAASGVAGFELRSRSAASGGSLRKPVVAPATKETRTVVAATPGSTYCFAVTARDLAGNSASTPAERCTAIPLDDRALTPTVGEFRRERQAGAFRATVTRGSEADSVLVRQSLIFRRLALVATRCPGCGTVAIYVNGVRIRRIDLSGATTQRKLVISVATFAKQRRGAVAIEIVSDGKPVEIDGLGVSRF